VIHDGEGKLKPVDEKGVFHDAVPVSMDH